MGWWALSYSCSWLSTAGSSLAIDACCLCTSLLSLALLALLTAEKERLQKDLIEIQEWTQRMSKPARLVSLSMRNCDVGDDGAEALAAVLQVSELSCIKWVLHIQSITLTRHLVHLLFFGVQFWDTSLRYIFEL